MVIRCFSLFLFTLVWGSAYPQQFRTSVIELKTIVTGLRLREIPALDGRIVETLPENAYLFWEGKTSTRMDTIVLRGRKVIAPWYRVRTGFDDPTSKGWVFGAGVAPAAFQLPLSDSTGRATLPVETPWITIREATESEFERLDEPVEPPVWLEPQPSRRYRLNDTTLVLPLAGGKTRTYRSLGYKAWSGEQRRYIYEGLLPGAAWHILLLDDGVDGATFAVRKKDGRELRLSPGISLAQAVFAPGRQLIAWPQAYDPGGMEGVVFARFDREDAQCFYVNLEGLRTVKEFRWENAGSGIGRFWLDQDTYRYIRFSFPR